MVNKATNSQQTSSIRGVVFLTLLLLATVSTLIALPHGIAYGIKSWVADHSDASVDIKNIDFNPITATLAIYGLDITQQGKSRLFVRKLKVRMTWTPLLLKTAFIDHVALEGVKVQIDYSNPADLILGGIPLPRASTAEAEESSSAPWAINLEKLTIQDAAIHYKDAQLNTHFQIDSLKLTRLTTHFPDQPALLRLEGALNNAHLSLKSEITPFSSEPKFDNYIQLDGLDFQPFAKLLEPYVGRIAGRHSLDSQLLIHRMVDGALKVAQRGTVSLLDMDVASAAGRFKNSQIQWKGAVQLLLSPQGTPQMLTAKGVLQTSPSQFSQEGSGLSIEQAEIRWEGDINHQMTDGGAKTVLSGGLLLGKTAAKFPEQQAVLQQDQLRWDGQLQLEPSSQGGQNIAINGQLNSRNLSVRLADREVTFNYDDLTWDGVVSFNMGETLEALALEGAITWSQLALLSPKERYTLLAFDQFQTDKITLAQDGSISSKQLEVTQLIIGRPEQRDIKEEERAIGLFQTKRLKIKDFKYSKQAGIDIETVQQENLSHLSRRDDEGNWSEQRLMDLIQKIMDPNGVATPGQATNETAAKTPSSLKSAMPIHIGKIHILGDSLILFQDKTTEPPYSANIKLQHFSINNINSATPEMLSPVKLAATVNEQSSIAFSGGIAPFAPKLTLDFTGKIEGFALPPLTAYTGKLLGYSLDSGELNVDIKLNAKAGKLQGENKLVLHQLDVSPLSKEKMKGLEAQLDIPLETALSMLRDSNNTISLSLPLSGATEDLKIDPSDAINQAIGKALKKGATTYLTAALFPFGTMLAVAQIAGEEMAKIRLDPVFFPPGLVALDKNNDPYFEKIAKILTERPELHIKVCGRATESDRAALLKMARAKLNAEYQAKLKTLKREKKSTLPAPPEPPAITNQQLESLAKTRAASIELYLAKQYQFKKNRLINCRPIVDQKSKKEKPRVEMLL